MFPTLESRDDILKMLGDVTEGRKAMHAACQRLTDAQLRDPVIPGTWSVLQNLDHLAVAQAYMLASMQARPQHLLPPANIVTPAPADLAGVATALDEAHAAVIAFLKSQPESVLREPCRYGRKGADQTVGGVFFHLVDHEIHHRAFVNFKLQRLLGG
jgi:uncharacterized damage-inducible protein DinB